jgi:nuclear transport factor 2 (NTF2) superfamily protein
MDSQETESFARRLMREVWEAFDVVAVPRFYNRDVVGHHRAQILNFEDILNRLAWDQKHNASPIFDIKDIVAAENRFAIRFEYTAREGEAEQDFHAEVIYFYHLRENKISEFWLLSDHDFDYKAEP